MYTEINIEKPGCYRIVTKGIMYKVKIRRQVKTRVEK